MDAIFAALEAVKAQREQQAAAPPAPVRPAPASVPPPVRPPAASVPRRPAPQQRPRAPEGIAGLFADGNSVLRAIIAGEVLGPPAALRENHLWTQQPNEPST